MLGARHLRPRIAVPQMWMGRPRSSGRPTLPTKGGKASGLDATLLSVLYYGVYCVVFGKMALVLLERAASALGGS